MDCCLRSFILGGRFRKSKHLQARATQQSQQTLTGSLMSKPLSSLSEAKLATIDLTGRVQVTKSEPFDFGAYSEVLEGTLQGFNGIVAIKVLRLVPSANRHSGNQLESEEEWELTMKRFRRESGLWCQLEHPNVLPFLGICSIKNSLALISPFCKSGNAVNFLRTNPHANRLDIIIGAARGMVYLHSRAVIHGDLKGHNILINDRGIACVGDFGRSRVLEQRGYTTGLATTPHYMAPELMQYNEEEMNTATKDDLRVTKESDAYAFGMVALELLTGSRPWYWLDSVQVIVLVSAFRQLAREKYPPLSDIQWNFLEDCWAKQPSKRLSMEQIVERLVSW